MLVCNVGKHLGRAALKQNEQLGFAALFTALDAARPCPLTHLHNIAPRVRPAPPLFSKSGSTRHTQETTLQQPTQGLEPVQLHQMLLSDAAASGSSKQLYQEA